MGPDDEPRKGGRLRRTSAVVRAWDGPNSRIAFEIDLDQMPWGPFEALGKRVTVLIPATTGTEETPEPSGEAPFEQALRHVEHAARKCAEFAQLGNGTDQGWRRSLETWEWLRDYLTTQWMEVDPDQAPSPGEPREESPLPSMPGAAAALEVAAAALRQTPLSVWQDAVGSFNPDAPTREESVQTLLGVARLLGRSGGGIEPSRASAVVVEGMSPETPGPPSGSEPPVGDATPAAPDADAPAAPSPEREEPPRGQNDLSFDFAAGYDEGYRMGRRVGRALAARERRRNGDV